MLFDFRKCKYLHTGYGNLDVNFKTGDTVLGTTIKETDLGVTINADMKMSEQCGIATSMGNPFIGLIRRNITYKKELIKRIRRRENKIIPELKGRSYEERLIECGLTTTETRRLRGG